jgi:hypothetical protein
MYYISWEFVTEKMCLRESKNEWGKPAFFHRFLIVQLVFNKVLF